MNKKGHYFSKKDNASAIRFSGLYYLDNIIYYLDNIL